jgi:GntR family transcriptional regulator
MKQTRGEPPASLMGLKTSGRNPARISAKSATSGDASESYSSGGAGELDAVPLYQKVVHTLKNEILNGAYTIGEQLPTEDRLRSRFGVSRHTVREALRQLRDDGLIVSRQGLGTTVVQPGAPHPFVHEVASINDLFSYSAENRYETDSSGIISTDIALARRLGVPQGQRWLRICGFRYPLDLQTPICWTEVFVHGDFAGVARFLGRRPGPIHSWIEDLYGERIAKVEQTLRAEPIPVEICSGLGAEAGSPGIQVQRVYYLRSDRVVEIAFSMYPADRFSHSMTLRRVKR